MRTRRIKVDAEQGVAVYHCMSRTVNGEHLFDDHAKEVLRKQLWQVAEYCGVQVLTYAIMNNHFHVLLRVPKREPVPDEELLRRYAVLYPKPTRYQQARIEVVAAMLKEEGNEDAESWREQQQALMGDVSSYMKLLKQRFSIWYNRTHKRYGTLWSERFKSVLMEADSRALLAVSAYIDLNPVRAHLVSDPKDYRYSGYGEALGGSERARAGLQRVTGLAQWREVHSHYRQMLYCVGAGARGKEGERVLSGAEVEAVMKAKGHLPLPEVLRCRVRYFTDGAVLGTREFVERQLEEYRKRYGRRKGSEPKPLPDVTDWGELTTLRGLRKSAFG